MLTIGTYIGLAVLVDTLAIIGGIEAEILLSPLFDPEQSVQIHPELVFFSVISTAVLIGIGVLEKRRTLSKGGPSVVEELGGTEVGGNTGDPAVRRYINIVEEMSLASGVPVPRTYVMEDQPAINAFAAGYTVNDAAIAITRGALRQLKRDELQAVVAHEFSHILNGDMRLNLHLIGLLHGIMWVYLTGIGLVKGSFSVVGSNSSSRMSKRAEANAIIFVIPGLVFLVVGSVGLFGSRLIKSAVVRQREYLADAAAVQFTRNPRSLISALKKIGGYTHGSRLRGPSAEVISHMCFGEGASGGRLTHPSVEQRILAFEPSFDPEIGFVVLDAETNRSGVDDPVVNPYETDETDEANATAIGADDVVGSVGEMSPEQLAYCATMLDEIPPAVDEARHSVLGAVVIAYLLILNDDAQTRQRQAEIIKEQASSSVAKEADRLWPKMRELEDELYLPLMDLLVPKLRQMTEEQYREFSTVADALVRADGEIGFREFVLERVVLHHLEVAFEKAGQKSVQFQSFSGRSRDLENTLSALAFAGAEKRQDIEAHFDEGRRHLPEAIRDQISLREPDRWDYETIGASLERLSMASPAIKKATIDACAHCALADDEITVREAEMLRAICEILDIPLPPLITQHKREGKNR